jgi:Set1/Ash2 histone methyltransferase complex subunit ASH2
VPMDLEAPAATVWSKVDKAAIVSVRPDRLTASNDKGYRVLRATHGVSSGTWYFEIKVTDMKRSAAVRVGWATLRADVEAPVGFDANGYSFGSVGGHVFNRSRRAAYGRGFGEGDVVGCLIALGDNAALDAAHGDAFSKGAVYKWRSSSLWGYTRAPTDDADIRTPGAIKFFVNGVCQGVAFRDMPYGGRRSVSPHPPPGVYYPAVSLYYGAEVRANFGGRFAYAPDEEVGGKEGGL